MDKSTDGKQTNDYFHQYYLKNKERISARNKAKYIENRNSPEKLIRHRERSLKATKKYRAKNIDKCRKYSRERHRQRKLLALQKIGNGIAKCVVCGCDCLDFLEINHKYGGGCKELKAINKGLKDLILNGKRKTDDLDVKCRVCNALDYLQRKNGNESKRYIIKWQ